MTAGSCDSSSTVTSRFRFVHRLLEEGGAVTKVWLRVCANASAGDLLHISASCY